MLLRHTEAEAATGAYSPPVPGSVPGRYDQAEQGAATDSATETLTGLTARCGHLATTAVTKTSRFDAREALCVTLWMAGMAFLGNMLAQYLQSATSGMLMPFPVRLGTIQGIISYAVLVLDVAVVGFVVGMLANRRTMTASIVAANIVGLLVTAFLFAYLYATLPPEAWAASTISTFGILFRVVTITVTEGAVAHYVARKFRKEP